MKNKIKLSLITFSALGIIGCGDSSSAIATNTTSSVSGQLVDSYISGIDYTCGDGKIDKTDINGTFTCEKLPVTFKLGNLEFGSISSMPADNHIFPNDLVGVDRNDTNNTAVLAMARLFQSFDSDGDPENGIDINETIADKFLTSTKFDITKINDYASEANVALKDENSSKQHLNQSIKLIQNNLALTKENLNASKKMEGKDLELSQKNIDIAKELDKVTLPSSIEDAILSPMSTLNNELETALTYMGDEERLAYDIYRGFYTLYPKNQFKNIPNNSEIKHLQAVQALIKKYDINSTELYQENNISKLPVGVYKTQEIQNMYNDLNATGNESIQGAYEVGCIIEVTDVEDLNTYITYAQESNASDIKTVLEWLRSGSYNHYWAFDKGLKNFAGISLGCCSLGEKYCKTTEQFPTSNNMSQEMNSTQESNTTKGMGSGSGQGQGKGKNK